MGIKRQCLEFTSGDCVLLSSRMRYYLANFWLSHHWVVGEMDHARLDVEFEQMLTSLKPYVIKIQQQSGLLMHHSVKFCQWFDSWLYISRCLCSSIRQLLVHSTLLLVLKSHSLCWYFCLLIHRCCYTLSMFMRINMDNIRQWSQDRSDLLDMFCWWNHWTIWYWQAKWKDKEHVVVKD